MTAVNNPTPQPQPSQRFTIDNHDIRVIAFQVLIAAVIGALGYLLKLNFGQYNVIVYPILMAIAEALRRYIN